MIVIPTLSLKGYAKSPEEIIDAVLLYYQSLNPSMTNRFKGKVRTLQATINRAGVEYDNMEKLAQYVGEDLTMIFGNLFPEGVTVDVTAKPLDGEVARYNLLIEATVSRNGVVYDVGKSLEAIDSRFIKQFNVEQE